MARRHVPSAVFAALAVALFWRVLFLGETLIATDHLATSPIWADPPATEVRNPWMSDTVEYYYPAEKLYSESVRNGALPLTDPYLFNGSPIPHGIHIWNSTWPVKILFLRVFSPVKSYDLFAIFHFWLAGVAFTALCRSRGCSPYASIVAALAFALSGRAMLWLHGHYLMATLAYAPLVFLWFRDRPLRASVPLAGLAFTNPHAAMAVSVAIFCFDRRAWKPVVLAALLSAIVWIPLLVIVSGSARDPLGEAQFFYGDGLKCWLLLAGLVAPGAYHGSMLPNEYNIYLGLLPLAGAVAGLRQERGFALMAGIVLGLATLWPLPVLIAPVSFSLPTRLLFLFTLGAGVCFARALDRVPPQAWIKAGVVAVVLVDLVPPFVSYNATYDPAPLHERPAVLDHVRGRTGWMLPPRGTDRPLFPPLSIHGIPSVQGYAPAVSTEQIEAAAPGAVRDGGGRTLEIVDPDSPKLEALGMKTLITAGPITSDRFRLAWKGSVFVYVNDRAPDVPPRRTNPLPTRVGLVVTLAGCVLLIVLAWRKGLTKT